MAQQSQSTERNRYPLQFQTVRDFHDTMGVTKPKILSFGCSNGDELLTIKEYFPDSTILGCDINLDQFFARKDMPPFDVFYSNEDNLRKYGPYDIIFANSVLCYYPAKRPVPFDFPFSEFKSLLENIHLNLRDDGFLCLYNMSYLFSELPFASEYRPIRNRNIVENGFVPKWHSSGQQISKKVDLLKHQFQYVIRPDLSGTWDFRDCIYQKKKGAPVILNSKTSWRKPVKRRQLPAFSPRFALWRSKG